MVGDEFTKINKWVHDALEDERKINRNVKALGNEVVSGKVPTASMPASGSGSQLVKLPVQTPFGFFGFQVAFGGAS